MDRRSGRWVQGRETEYRDHNRYGYTTRIERRRTANERRRVAGPSRGKDLREFINRLRASRDAGDDDDDITRDVDMLKRAVHQRFRERDGYKPAENRPSQRGEITAQHLTAADGIIDDMKRLTISELSKVAEELKRLGIREMRESGSAERSSAERKKRNRSPGAREVFRSKFARRDDDTGGDHLARTREELAVDEERRALWKREEARRNALMDAETKWQAERRKEEEDRRTLRENEDEARKKRQAEEDKTRRERQDAEDEERKRWFRMEMEEFREGLQESLNDSGNKLREYVDRQVEKSRKGKKSSK